MRFRQTKERSFSRKRNTSQKNDENEECKDVSAYNLLQILNINFKIVDYSTIVYLNIFFIANSEI